MTALILKLTPESVSSIKAGQGALSVTWDGGRGRNRATFGRSVATLRGTWLAVTEAQYNYIMAFYRQVGMKGLTFFVLLPMNGVSLTKHKAKFVPKTFKVKARGSGFTINAELEVSPKVEP